MTQPKYAPIPIEDEVRPSRRLGPALPWKPARPGELVKTRLTHQAVPEVRRAGRGAPGPDQGYALRLAERFAERLVLQPGEHPDDVLAGAVAVAMRRAAVFGRAPVATDLEVALHLFGFLAPASEAQVAARKACFAGVGHDEWRRRALANDIAEADLRRTAGDAAAHPLEPGRPAAG